MHNAEKGWSTLFFKESLNRMFVLKFTALVAPSALIRAGVADEMGPRFSIARMSCMPLNIVLQPSRMVKTRWRWERSATEVSIRRTVSSEIRKHQ